MSATPERVLLHTCCGPCACACVPVLKSAGHRSAMYFANSNIDTREEYDRRLAEARKVAAVEGVELYAEPYDHADWLEKVAARYEDAPEKGTRCERCYRYNLAKTAAFAATHGYDGFTTSLTVSPHKPSKAVFAAGHDCGEGFLEFDFKKRGGFLVSTRRAAELGLYRQSYCGCEFTRSHQRASN